jgi:hypothetical protein
MSTSPKLQLSHASAVIVIYRQSDPRQVLADRKDKSHPDLRCRLRLCPIGGNRTSNRSDKGPRDLALGEFMEEITFDRGSRDSREYVATGLVDNKVCAVDETWSGLRFVVRVAERKKAERTTAERIKTERKKAKR